MAWIGHGTYPEVDLGKKQRELEAHQVGQARVIEEHPEWFDNGVIDAFGIDRARLPPGDTRPDAWDVYRRRVQLLVPETVD